MICLMLELSQVVDKHHGRKVASTFYDHCREGIGMDTLNHLCLKEQMALINDYWRKQLEKHADTTHGRAYMSIEDSLESYLMLFRVVWLPYLIKHCLNN